MKAVCFLSMDDLTGYVSDDELAVAPLAELDIRVETVPWRQRMREWSEFDAVVIRTTWDYQRSPVEFLDVLAEIEAATRLLNSRKVVEWNFDKIYLRELRDSGVDIVSTLFETQYSQANFARWLDELDAPELIVKPRVSATAEHTFRLREFDASLESIFAERPFLVQPFLDEIVRTGEYSLFYFDGEFSHAILKEPKTHDFRVQEEHGGIISAVEATDAMRNAAAKALSVIPEKLLYARVDLVPSASSGFQLMELELIEPALYFRMEEHAAKRFAEAVARSI
ncbi:MAG: Cycloserine biosynthesis protein DcsG [Acidobacteria bacterium OLB17]|nr:MAG: Cycloserine biosynthesis protein DcsG [Acidobacteria bacterium OLB17]